MVLETTFRDERALEEKKLSPSNLLDTVISYFRAHGGEMTKAVGRFAKDHPAVALMGVGVAWNAMGPFLAATVRRTRLRSMRAIEAPARQATNR